MDSDHSGPASDLLGYIDSLHMLLHVYMLVESVVDIGLGTSAPDGFIVDRHSDKVHAIRFDSETIKQKNAPETEAFSLITTIR